MTRRVFILAGTVLGGAVIPVAWAASGDFWDHEDPSAWSPDEIHRLLNKSPWAKQTDVAFNFGRGRGGGLGGGRRGGFGLPGGGGLATPGIGGGYPGGPPDTGGSRRNGQSAQVLVRWESAKPIREAAKKELPSDAAGYYVISVTGFPIAPTRGRGPFDSGSDSDGQPEARIKDATSLQVKGQQPLYAAKMEGAPGGGNSTMLFYFSREAQPLSLNNKEATIEINMGPLVMKVKFPLKEMVYRGKLEL